MAQFDENGDGRISRDEMSGPLRERATLFDANGDGNLSKKELQAAFQRMGSAGVAERSPDHVTAKQLVSRMDTNADGKITMDEAPEQLKNSFAAVDRNGDGGIDVKEAQVMADYTNRQSR